MDLGKKVLVIGGGNVAFDVARTAARQIQKDTRATSDIISALDVARSAVRFGGKDVEVVCLEALDELPATLAEMEDADVHELRQQIRNAILIQLPLNVLYGAQPGVLSSNRALGAEHFVGADQRNLRHN